MRLGLATRRGILTGGTWCADHNKLVSDWPSEEMVVEILTNDVRGGGSACNLAVDMKRLDQDMPVSTIGLVGDDEDGKILLAEADAAGIERSGLRVAHNGRTSHTDAFTSQTSGRRTHLYLPGTAAELTPGHFDLSASGARFLHLGLPGVHAKMDAAWGQDPNGWVTVLKEARKAGFATNLELCSVSAERIAELARPCLAHLDLLVVNDFEIAAIAGLAGESGSGVEVQNCVDAARMALEAGAMQLVVVHFPHGAVALSRDGGEFSIPSVAVPLDSIQGTNGAGDAFAAGLLYGLHEDWSITDAIHLGHASAAASMRGLGTTDKVVSWRECLDLATRWGWRETL